MHYMYSTPYITTTNEVTKNTAIELTKVQTLQMVTMNKRRQPNKSAM